MSGIKNNNHAEIFWRLLSELKRWRLL